MKILLHSCCGPCTIYPLEQLLSHDSHRVDILFYNPNIHPFREYRNRLNSLKTFSEDSQLNLHYEKDYNLDDFFHAVVFNEKKRCQICYELRLRYLFRYAKDEGFEAVTTTLLYSKFQNHQQLISIGDKLALEFNIIFLYEDFRLGWQEGIDKSIELDMYRQTYCGCIYSEQERYDNRLKKRMNKLRKLKKN